MKRREFIALVGGGAMAWPLASRGQQGERVRRIGVLASLPESEAAGMPISAFLKRLEERGWFDGRNITLEYRYTKGQPDLIRKYAAELIALGPDVIVSSSAPNVVALQKGTSTIPIVFIYVSDPVAMGVVKEMARPGGNITGFAAFEPSLSTKWLELLKEIAPSVSRAAIIYNPNTAPNSPSFVGPARNAASALGVSVILSPVRDNDEIEHAMAELARESSRGIILVPDPFTAARPELIATAALRHRLPVVSPFRWISNAGALLSYGIDAPEQNRQAAEYVNRILRGEKPADLPVQQPTKFELVINRKTAKALGLTVPPTLLARADEVID